MLGSRVMLADDGGGPAAVVVTAAVAASAAAAVAAASAGRAGAWLPRGAAVELRLHGFIELPRYRFFGDPFCPFLFCFVGACVPFRGSSLFESAGCLCPFLVVFYSCFYFGVGVLEPFCFYAEGEGVNIFCGVVWA